MTPSEREQWLRDRGVQIETSTDRRQAEALLSCTSEGRPLDIVEQVQRLSCNDDVVKEKGIKFVYIPHDTSRPISTIYLPRRFVEAFGPSGDIIRTYVKAFFADGKSFDETLFKEQVEKKNLIGGDINQDETSKLTSAALTNATASGSVEIFPLVRPSSTNHNQGVYIYLDEVGLFKHLPNNKRASALAQHCGYHPSPMFYGDVFVGRVSSENFLHNIDIEKEDVIDATKEWMIRAPHENVAWQQTINEVTGRKGESQPNHAGTEGVGVKVESRDAENGSSYVWIQNEEEVDISVDLSKKVGDGKKANKNTVKVAFQRQNITIKYDKETVLELKLYSKINVDGCTWTLDNNNLVMTCEKASEREMWPRLELSE